MYALYLSRLVYMFFFQIHIKQSLKVQRRGWVVPLGIPIRKTKKLDIWMFTCQETLQPTNLWRGLSRLVWFGIHWGCAVDGVILACNSA